VPVFEDVRGLALTAANQAAVAAFDATVAAYLGFARDTGERLKAVFAADPEMPMAHVLKGYFFHLMAVPALKRKAAGVAAEAARFMAGASAREQQHLQALLAWCKGDLRGAARAWDAILVEHPRDALALKLAHYVYFYLGDARNLRDVVARALWAWDETVSGRAHVLAMYAFGLEESRDFAKAERMGREAVDLDPAEAWAVHAVAHVMEMQDRAREGIAWITAHEAGWQGCNNFRYHLVWHRALMHLGRGDTAEVLRQYDTSLYDPASSEYLDLCNDVALLLRLELAGCDVGDRYAPLAAKVRGQCDEPVLGFIDVHYAAALAAAGEPGEAARFLADRTRFSTGFGDPEAGPVVQAVAGGLLAWRERDHARAVELLLPVRPQMVRLGGSHAQRDLFDLVLIDAAVRSGRLATARSLLAERVACRPDNCWGWLEYERVARAMGDGVVADRARDRVDAMQMRS